MLHSPVLYIAAQLYCNCTATVPQYPNATEYYLDSGLGNCSTTATLARTIEARQVRRLVFLVGWFGGPGFIAALGCQPAVQMGRRWEVGRTFTGKS